MKHFKLRKDKHVKSKVKNEAIKNTKQKIYVIFLRSLLTLNEWTDRIMLIRRKKLYPPNK